MKSSPEPTIGILTWDFGKPKGGMGHVMQSLAQVLQQYKKNVSVLTPCPDIYPTNPFLRITKGFGGHLLFSLLLPFSLKYRMNKEGVRQLILPVGPGGVFLLKKPSVPVIAIVYHTYDQQSRLVPGQSWKKMFIGLECRTLNMASTILCFCEDTQRVLINHYHIPADRIHLLPHGIDLAFWSVEREKRPLSCVCIARLEARKGVDVLLQAWKCVIEKEPRAHLTIVGQGTMQPEVDAMIRSLGHSVERRSGLTLEDLRELVASSEIALCPAYLEGFGLACAEAMAAGTAVIASDTDGLRSLIDHERTGLLVKPGDEISLAEAILTMLKDGNLRSQLRDAARIEATTKFDPHRAADALVKIVDSLVV